MPSWTISDILANVPSPPFPELPTPSYVPSPHVTDYYRSRDALAVSSMKDHMTDEGWQIMRGLQHAGYTLWGKGCERDTVDVSELLKARVGSEGTVLVQDKREWDLSPRDFRDPGAAFVNYTLLKDREDVFKLTILKDAQQRPAYHRDSAEEMGVHAWVVYYHPRIVKHLAPYVRANHLVRTYHTVDPLIVPPFNSYLRYGALLSGAVSGAYPLRTRLVNDCRQLWGTQHLKHPGYHRKGSCTPEFLDKLSHFKVAICTASCYGYLLRKIIEATACGCVVLTDLPGDEVVPVIDENLVRVHPSVSIQEVSTIVQRLCKTYDPEKQQVLAAKAKARYDYRVEGQYLANQIEILRKSYNQE